MKKNINQLKWNKRFKGVNIIINDNKRLIKMFEGKYQQFLFRNKGTEISSKEDIINLLNRKPRSFLTTLNILVRTFKTYDQRLTAYISKLHPKQITSLTKKTSNSPSLAPRLSFREEKRLESAGEITKLSNSKLISPKKNFEILTEKINKLKKSLQNNKLAIPLNLFNPLLKINSSLKFKNFKGFGDNLKQTPIKYVQMPEFDFSDILGHKLDWRKTEHKEYNALYDFKTKVTKFTDLIKKYNTNNIVPLTKIKYLKLITSLKFNNSFQENINYKFNTVNNKKIQNIFTLLEYAFRGMSCLISKPVYMETPNKLIINLFYFLVPGKVKKFKKIKRATVPIATSLNGISIPGPQSPLNGGKTLNNKNSSLRSAPVLYGKKNSLKKLNSINKHKVTGKILFSPKNIKKLNNLCTILSRLFKKPIELDLVRLHLPYFDDNILVKAIGIMSKKIHVRNIFKYIFSKTIIHSKRVNNLTNKGSIIPSFLAGIKIKIGGRLMSQRVIPRLSTRIIQRGAIARGKVNYVDWSRVNLKNKRGAYSITVTMSHVL